MVQVASWRTFVSNGGHRSVQPDAPWPPFFPCRIPNVRMITPSISKVASWCFPSGSNFAPSLVAIASASRFWIRLRDKVFPQHLQLALRQRAEFLWIFFAEQLVQGHNRRLEPVNCLARSLA